MYIDVHLCYVSGVVALTRWSCKLFQPENLKARHMERPLGGQLPSRSSNNLLARIGTGSSRREGVDADEKIPGSKPRHAIFTAHPAKVFIGSTAEFFIEQAHSHQLILTIVD